MGIVSKNRKFFERRPSSDKRRRRRSSLSSLSSTSLSSSLTKSLTLIEHRGGGPSHLRVVNSSDLSNGGMTNEEIDRHIESLLSSLDNSNKSSSFSSRFSSSFTSNHSTSSILSCQEIREQIKLAALNISSMRNKDVTIYNEIIDSLLAYLDEEPLTTQQQRQQVHSTQGMTLDDTTSLDEAVIDYNHRGLIDYDHEYPIPGVKRCSMLSSSSLSFDDDGSSSLEESSLDETIVDYKHRQLPSASTVVDYEQYWSKGVLPQPIMMCQQSPTNYDQDTKLDIASPPTLISFATPGIDKSVSKTNGKKQEKSQCNNMISPDQYYTCISKSLGLGVYHNDEKKQHVSSSSPGGGMLPFLPMSPGATAA